MLHFKKNAISALIIALSASATNAYAAGSDFSDWLDAKQGKSASQSSSSARFIVTYKVDSEDTDVSTRVSNVRSKTAQNVEYMRTMKGDRYLMSFDEEKSASEMESLFSKMMEDESIESVEMDYKRYPLAQSEPWGISTVQADTLSDSGASDITVCIIDTGLDRDHEDLVDNNSSGTNDSGTGNWYEDGYSHGTHVAGTIAAVNNSEGVYGVLPNTYVNLHIVKVFDDSGSWTYSSDLADAVDTCVDAGADVVNMSLGGSSSSNSEEASMEAAEASGVILVAAAGNDGDSSHSYPASYDSVISVAALDENNQRAVFSQYTDQVELGAPGEAVLSTVSTGGRLGEISIGSETWYNEEGVVPQSRYIVSGSSYVSSDVDGTVSGELDSCSLSGSSYSCGDMSGKICLVERYDNQDNGYYPEIDNGVEDCVNAGASGVIVYSNDDRPGLQKPYLVDEDDVADVPVVSVNQTVGEELLTYVGESTTLEVVSGQDYSYYNGTSMATPHVAGVAALVWANAPECSADQIRTALAGSALDLETDGRDDYTGYGLVQAADAITYLGSDCGASQDPIDDGEDDDSSTGPGNGGGSGGGRGRRG